MPGNLYGGPGGMNDVSLEAARERREEPRWAVYQAYNPFTMGGDVVRIERYPVYQYADSEFRGFKFFVYESVPGKWEVHERTTGAYVCEADLPGTAIAKCVMFVAGTEDFGEQLRAMGSYEAATEVPESRGRSMVKQIRAADEISAMMERHPSDYLPWASPGKRRR